jgi:hypothetical protein
MTRINLIAKTTDKSLSDVFFNPEALQSKKFHLIAPSYAWEVEKEVLSLPEELFVSILVENYLKNCLKEEKDKLTGKDLAGNSLYYLRFMLYQDTPTSKPYIYGYLREIDNISYESHKNFLKLCKLDKIPVEVNFATYGLYIFVDKDAVISETIYSKDVKIMD